MTVPLRAAKFKLGTSSFKNLSSSSYSVFFHFLFLYSVMLVFRRPSRDCSASNNLKIGTRSVHVGSREKIGELRNKNRANAFLMSYKACFPLGDIVCRIHCRNIRTKFRWNINDYFAEKSICFDKQEVYFQLFTQTRELSENIGFSRARAAHQDSMLF